MKKHINTLLIAAGLMATLAGCEKQPKPAAPAPTPMATTAQTAQWHTNFDTALDLAKSQRRLLFMLFTASDSCPYCVKLEQEILVTPEFKDYARDKFVLFMADYPQKTQQPDNLRRQNAKLAKLFEIKATPTILIFDHKTTKLIEVGYTPAGPTAFIQAINELLKQEAKK